MYIDSNAAELYKIGGKIDKLPVYVESDGNTLFSAMSVLLCGEEYLATEIRASTVASMIKNRPAITDAARSKGLHLNTEINYEKNLFNVASFDPLFLWWLIVEERQVPSDKGGEVCYFPQC